MQLLKINPNGAGADERQGSRTQRSKPHLLLYPLEVSAAYKGGIKRTAHIKTPGHIRRTPTHTEQNNPGNIPAGEQIRTEEPQGIGRTQREEPQDNKRMKDR